MTQHISEILCEMFEQWPQKPLVDDDKEAERQARIRERYVHTTI